MQYPRPLRTVQRLWPKNHGPRSPKEMVLASCNAAMKWFKPVVKAKGGLIEWRFDKSFYKQYLKSINYFHFLKNVSQWSHSSFFHVTLINCNPVRCCIGIIEHLLLAGTVCTIPSSSCLALSCYGRNLGSGAPYTAMNITHSFHLMKIFGCITHWNYPTTPHASSP